MLLNLKFANISYLISRTRRFYNKSPLKGGDLKRKTISCLISGFSRFCNREDLNDVLGGIVPLKIEAVLDPTHYPSGKYQLLLKDKETYEALRMSVNENHLNRFSVLLAPEELKLSDSKINVTSRSVRCKDLSKTLDVNNIAMIFENYGVSVNGVTRLPNEISTFLINFESPEEAERAVIEKSQYLVMGRRLQLFWYQC